MANAENPTGRREIEMPKRWTRALTALSILHAVVGAAGPAVGAEDKIAMPLGAFECKTIEPVVEHAKIVREPTTAGLRPFVEAKVASGECRVVASEVTITVADVDPRGFALVQRTGATDRWWTDAENVWGYFDAPEKVKGWKKP